MGQKLNPKIKIIKSSNNLKKKRVNNKEITNETNKINNNKINNNKNEDNNILDLNDITELNKEKNTIIESTNEIAIIEPNNEVAIIESTNEIAIIEPNNEVAINEQTNTIIVRNNEDQIIKITEIINIDENISNEENIIDAIPNDNTRLILNNKIIKVDDSSIKDEIKKAIKNLINNEKNTQETYFNNFVKLIKEFENLNKEIIFMPLELIVNVEKNYIKKNNLNKEDFDSLFNSSIILDKINNIVNNFKNHVPDRYVFIPVKILLSFDENSVIEL